MSEREFHVMFNGSYPAVPSAKLRRSNYIDLPTEHYDALEGQKVLERMVTGAQLVERLGYDGVAFSEQHNGPIGLLGNPMIFGGYLAAATQRIRIGVIGPIMNSYLSPIRLAEEIAQLDILSKGRLMLGLPLGHGMQYHSVGMINPATARARYREAHELLIRALTDPGPFEWYGEHFQVPYVNLWPRPVQAPHPPVVILGGGSAETIDLVAKHRHSYQAVGISSRKAVQGALEKLRAGAERYGYELDPRQIWAGVTFHVAETDAQAMAEARPHYLWMMQNFFDSPFHDSFPPGYLSPAALRGMLAGGGYRSKPPSDTAFEDAVEAGNLIVGSPETVHDRLVELIDLYGAGRILLNTNSDIKPEWMSTKSLTLFAEQVLPRLRGAKAGNEPEGPYTTELDYRLRRSSATPEPSVMIDGAPVALDDLRRRAAQTSSAGAEARPVDVRTTDLKESGT